MASSPALMDAAVDAVVGEVPHQLRTHVDARLHPVGQDLQDLQAQHLVEDNLFFKDGGEALDKLGLELGGWLGSCSSCEAFRRKRGAWRCP